MRNLLLNIRYDGADYHGWQVQKNAVTVQEAFQNAVEKVFGARLPVRAAPAQTVVCTQIVILSVSKQSCPLLVMVWCGR